MLFEYDPEKSARNLDKHGIDFEDAQALWLDRDRVEFRLEHTGEQRYGVLARWAGICWLAVVVHRGERVRIVSTRRATRKEAALYDQTNNR
ncbi:toxin [Gordonibacter sp. 28C]|uniref:BrnT family toxin n=1 Tax=Gordonibacter sp. 28C TaxID=2078569 RepID=UPI000DF74183|nr:BrnT family toxin [Gordonibacter sp. 28C]RDB59455.1 toxin [Gordonibacter sp. 28C]